MSKVLIVGSGASGVHFALSVLQKGYEVVMLDVGHVKPSPVNPQDSFTELKTNLRNPVQYFLGQQYEAVLYPGLTGEYYGFPPSKRYVFTKPSTINLETHGFQPLFSFAQGGLAEAWTAGVYRFNNDELKDFPFGYRDIEPYYDEVTRRIGITGTKDDLARFFPSHETLSAPLQLDFHSQHLLAEYERVRDHLNKKFKCFLGRSRIATLSIDQDGRKGCTYCGRCLWGCPTEALYTPSVTLNRCLQFPNFNYIPNMHVSHFKYNSAHHISTVVAESVREKTFCEFTADTFVLAAGTLSSSRIFMDSMLKNSGKFIRLHGLMDNRQILIPFINLKMIGKQYDPESYQYHQIALGIESEKPEEYIHGQITTLKTALVHPIIHNIPLDLRTAVFMFRNLRAGLGVINLNFPDRRREDNYMTLQASPQSGGSQLMINYVPHSNEKTTLKHGVRTVKKLLWKLGCIVPPAMRHIRPMGASVHYAGTLPMSTEKIPLTTSTYCQSHDFDNLYIVDGTTFPFLPAKNITLTLMANAIRVADHAF